MRKATVGTFGIYWKIRSTLFDTDVTSFSGQQLTEYNSRREIDTVAIVTRLCFSRHCSLITTGCHEVSISAVHLNPSASPDSLLALVLARGSSNYPTGSARIIF